MSSLSGLRREGGSSGAVDGSGDSDEETETAPAEAPNWSSPLAQMFSQRTLLAEFDLPSSPNAWMAPPGGGRCPAPEPELPLPAGSGRVSPVANLHDNPLPRSSAPTWAELTMPASAAELALGTALIALGESTHTASSKAMDELPFTLLSGSADLLGGRAVPRGDVGGCAGLANLETTEGFLRLACGTMSPPATPEHGDQSGWTSQTSGRGRSRAAPGRSSGSASPPTSDCNPFAPLASLHGEDPLSESREREAPVTGRHVPHYTAVSPDRSRDHRRGSRGSAVGPDEDDDLPPAHFVSSTETMSQIFTLPYMDSEVSIVLHRIGGMLVMEGTLNGSDLGSGDVSASGRGRRRGREHDEHLASNFLFFSSGNNADAATGGGRSLHSTGVHSATPAKAPARSVETASAAASFRHKFMWEFEDFGLLLGSDMIVFSNAKHPKFSMQLHDVDQEVSSLACLELWMNNVFQSIPETGICCHKDGFVQGYKLMKTSELPTLSGAMPSSYSDRQFQPAAVMEHGASILKFLHTNCDRDGATYWLHRNPNDGSLQLFEVPLGAEEARTGKPDEPESASPRGEQEQQLSISVATLVFRMAERFAEEDGAQQFGTSQGGVAERRLRLYRRCVELVDVASAPLLWAAATERIAEFNLGSLSTLETLTLHAARRISSGRDHLTGSADKSSALVANALETLSLLCAARDATASLGSRSSQDAAAKEENNQTEETVRRLTLRVAHICLWLGSQCLAVGCAFPPTSPPRSPRSKSEPDASACLEPQPDIGAGLHQLALASWLLQQINVPAEPGRAGTEGRQHVVALLTITSRAFAELAQAGVRGGQLKAAAGPAVVKLAAAQAAAGLRGDDPTRFSVASILGMDSEAITLAASSGGWLGQHVHAAAVVPGMDAEQNFNQSVQFLLRALRLCGPGPDSTAPGVGGHRGSTSGQATAARPAAAGGHNREPEIPLNRADGGKKRTAPFTADSGAPTVGGTKELVVVPGQRRAKDSEAVGSAISEALGTVYHALGDHYIATGRRTKAHRHCQQGITLFNSICDRPNAALCMAAIGRIVRSGAIETDSERSFSNAAVDVYTTALSWYRQAREMLTPRSAYPRTWRQLRPELAATAAAGAALLQAQLPQLADKQRVDAELETLAALSDAMAAYREVLAEAEGKGNSDAASLDSAPAPAMDMAPLGVNEALSTALGAKVAAKLGDLEHQLGLFHGWRAAITAPAAEDARGTRLRKLALTQAEKHLSQAVRWLQLSASGPSGGSGDPIAASPETFPQADVAALRKQVLSQLDHMQTNRAGEDENLEAATFKKIVQLSVRASVEMSRLPQQLTASAPAQLPTGVELIRQTFAAAPLQ